MTPRAAAELAVIGLGTIVVPLDTMVNVAFPAIVAAFAIPVPAIQWTVICYVLVHACLMLACGRLGDLFGYRRIFLIGCAVGAVAFVGTVAAPGYGWFLAARGLQGVGAALVFSVGPALATAAVPDAQRLRVLGLYTMIFAAAAAAGPPLAGVLIEAWGWSAVFAIRVPLALAGFALAWWLPRRRPERAVGRFDLAGGTLFALALGALLLALDQLQPHGALPRLLGFAALAAAAWRGFLWVQRRSAAPLIELRHFADRRLGFALAAATLTNLAGFAIMLLGPFLLARIAVLTPLEAGLVLAASPLGMALAAPQAGRVAARIGMARLTDLGLAAAAAGLAILGFGAAGLLTVTAGMFVQGIGQGLFQVANVDFVTSALPARDRGVAGSLALLTRTLGLVLGATLLMLVMQSLATDATPAAMVAAIAATCRLAALLPVLLLLIHLWLGR